MVVKDTRWFPQKICKIKFSGIQRLKISETLGNLKSSKDDTFEVFELPQNNRGQLKIQQMAFMLIAVTLFFALVGLFLIVFVFSGLKESATALQEKNALLLVTKLANSPEFSCGDVFFGNKINCVDADKVMMLKENLDKYKGFWGVTNIEIQKVYPVGSKVCTLANYPNCSVIKVYSLDESGYSVSNFVSLCRKDVFDGEVSDRCELAKLIVSYKEAE